MRQRCSLGDQPSDAYLSSLLGKSHFIATAATIHELVVGGLTAYQLDKFEQDRREIYIYDLAVNEEYRRRDIDDRGIAGGSRATGCLCYIRAS